MAESTGIEWADATFNPWVGCEKVSPGCAHCYAETLVTGRMGRAGTWGADGTRERTSPSNWRKPLRWEVLAQQGLLPDGETETAGRRPRIFCASLADVFEPRPELDPWRDDLFAMIRATPSLDWLILTKRPYTARDWLDGSTGRGRMFPGNVWLGTSIENSRHTWRADILRDIPGLAVRFLSCEPLLGSLFATDFGHPSPAAPPDEDDGPRLRRPLSLAGIDWVIVGGESGPGARPMHPAWVRELRDACTGGRHFMTSGPNGIRASYVSFPVGDPARGPAFLFKQWGEWVPVWAVPPDPSHEAIMLDPDGSYRAAAVALPAPGAHAMMRTGKRAAGRSLDDRTWTEFPQARPTAERVKLSGQATTDTGRD